jgi:hypothetical protein
MKKTAKRRTKDDPARIRHREHRQKTKNGGDPEVHRRHTTRNQSITYSAEA